MSDQVCRDRSERRKFVLAWGALLAVKLVLAALLPLLGDEAFYWWEGQHPAWAYSDLPGGSAWLARLAVEVGGQSPLGLRWPFILLGAAVPWLMVRIARRWFGAEAGWRAGWLALLLPLVAGLGVLALPDVPLTLATLLCLDAVADLLERVERATVRHEAQSAPTGALIELALGLALGAFSHYRFALIVVAGALALLCLPQGRRLLSRSGFLLAGAVGACAWLPLLWWNWQEGGAGLSFQLLDRHPWRFSWEGALYPAMQMLIVTPVLFMLLLIALVQSRRSWRGDSGIVGARHGLVFVLAAVPLFGYFGLGFFADRERFSLHWPLPAYLALLPVLAARWPDWHHRARRGAIIGATLIQLALLAWLCAAAIPALRIGLAAEKAYPGMFAGWREIAERTNRELAAMPPDTVLVADNFMLGAQLAFALHPRPIVTLAHPHDAKHGRARQLAIWGQGRERLPAGPSLLIVEDSLIKPRQRLRAYQDMCRRAGPLPSPRTLNVDLGRKRYLIYSLLEPPAEDAPCRLPSLAWIDAPAPGAVLTDRLELTGWAFKDGAGVARVEVLIDGEPVSEAEYGLPMPHVAEFWGISNDPAHPDVGLRARIDLDGLAPGRHRLGLRVHGRDGAVEELPEQFFRIVSRSGDQR